MEIKIFALTFVLSKLFNKIKMKKPLIPIFKVFLFIITFTSCTINNYYDCCNNEDVQNENSENNFIVIQPNAEEGKDAFIEDYPLRDYNNTNFGTHEAFQASTWTAQGIPMITRAIIDFDFTLIPTHKQIKCAKLILSPAENTSYGTGHSNRSGSNEFLIQRITSKWNEQTVTWNNQPAITTNSQVLVAGTSNTMLKYEIVVTKLIKDILENPSQSHGLMLRLVNEKYYRRILFASSDYEDPSKHPKLVIEIE